MVRVGMGSNPVTGIDIASSSAIGRAVVLDASCSRGRNRVLDTVNPGSMSVLLDNQLREFDPFNTAGPLCVGGVSQVKPGPWIQLSATGGALGTTVYYLWSGFLTDLPVSWGVGEAAVSTWSATEALVALGRSNPTALAVAVGDSELTGTRIDRILTSASWPAATSVFPPFGFSRALDSGMTHCQATTLGSNSLAEAQTVVLTERGDLFTSGAGVMTFKNRGYRFVQRNGVTNAIFGDGGLGEIPYVEGTLVIGNNSDLYRNTAHIAGIGMTPQTSIVTGPYVSDYSQTALYLKSDAEAASQANWVTATYSAGDLRVEQITVQPTDGDPYWPTLLGLEIGQWVTVKFRPPGSNGGVVVRECFVEGITHSIPAEGAGPWSITYFLGDATAYAGPWFVLDDPIYGRLDQGNKLIF